MVLELFNFNLSKKGSTLKAKINFKRPTKKKVFYKNFSLF